MNRQEPPTFSARSLAIWLALGLLGIGLAVAIALVARNLADQPVGIAGEPVSAGRALDPPRNPAPGNNSGGANRGQDEKDRKKEQADREKSPDDGEYTPPANTGTPGGSSGGGSTAAPSPGNGSSGGSGGSGESHGDEGGGQDSDDD